MTKRAFTLIELLVVIAIIAILAAILFPVFAQAKVAAKATVILSNQKQQELGVQMYQADVDDIQPSYITRTFLGPDLVARPDCVSWVQQIEPYIKNGAPALPANYTSSTNGVKPNGIFDDSEWTSAKWIAAADQSDCDGAGALDKWAPVVWAHAYYGIAFGANNIGIDPFAFGGADTSAGSQANPFYDFAGSMLAYRFASQLQGNNPVSATSIARPAETAVITDGFTGVINGGSFGVTMGCEAAQMYKGGGNVGFSDGHAKFVKGNSQRYLSQDTNGNWFMKYFMANE